MASLIATIISFWAGIFDGLNGLPLTIDISAGSKNILTFLGLSGTSFGLGDMFGYIFAVITVLVLVLVPVYVVWRLGAMLLGTMRKGAV